MFYLHNYMDSLNCHNQDHLFEGVLSICKGYTQHVPFCHVLINRCNVFDPNKMLGIVLFLCWPCVLSSEESVMDSNFKLFWWVRVDLYQSSLQRVVEFLSFFGFLRRKQVPNFFQDAIYFSWQVQIHRHQRTEFQFYFYHIYQPLRSGRIWHKVSLLPSLPGLLGPDL